MKLRAGVVVGVGIALIGCGEPISLSPPPNTTEMQVGESRTLTLRALRLDVEDFEKTMTIADLRALPKKTLEETWLLDLDAQPLVENALVRFAGMPAEEVQALPVAAQNLFYLLNMTPENARLGESPLDKLVAIGEAVGISPSRILADLTVIGPNQRIAPIDVVAGAVVDQVIRSHPNAHMRKGPVTAVHPDGLYPVVPGALAVNLYDFATDFASFADRFGPARSSDGTEHPGFLESITGLGTAIQDVRLIIRADVNALPFDGINAFRAAKVSVNSMGMQIDRAFDFSDPKWLDMTGLDENLVLSELRMRVEEDDAFLPGGTMREPFPLGNSPVWLAKPWVIERVLAEAARRVAAAIPAHCTTYSPAGRVAPPFEAVRVCIDSQGWVEIRVDPSVVLDTSPPLPSYFWDLLLEVAQVRMHDGGLAEGQANVVMPVQHVSAGMRTADILSQIRKNFENDPLLLKGVAEALTDNTRGDADFFYVQPGKSIEDWLYFVDPEDIRRDDAGDPVRPYTYRHVGFYLDSSLRNKVSSRSLVDGDAVHEKVRIRVGDRLYVEDAEGRRYELHILEKPSPHRISVVVRRVS